MAKKRATRSRKLPPGVPRRGEWWHIVRQELMNGHTVAAAAKAAAVDTGEAERQLEYLIANGFGTANGRRLDPIEYLSVKQVHELTGLSPRRIRKLVEDKRMTSQRLGGLGPHVIDTDSFLTFAKIPRLTGVPGQQALHGSDWVNPYTNNGRKPGAQVAQKKTARKPSKKARRKAKR